MVKVKQATTVGLGMVIIGGMMAMSVFAATQITAEQAKKIAIDAVDEKKAGTITDVALENEDGFLVYAVEFSKDGIETDVKINVVTGKIVKIENDIDEMNPKISPSELANVNITAEQARSIALDAVDEEEVGGITDVELEELDGVLVYAVEFSKGGMETDVKINAESGKVEKIVSDKN